MITNVFKVNWGAERGTGQLIGYFSDREKAITAAKGKGWYGGDGEIRTVKAIQEGDVYYEIVGKSFILDKNLEQVQAEMAARIKKTLSPDELEFIRKNPTRFHV